VRCTCYVLAKWKACGLFEAVTTASGLSDADFHSLWHVTLIAKRVLMYSTHTVIVAAAIPGWIWFSERHTLWIIRVGFYRSDAIHVDLPTVSVHLMEWYYFSLNV